MRPKYSDFNLPRSVLEPLCSDIQRNLSSSGGAILDSVFPNLHSLLRCIVIVFVSGCWFAALTFLLSGKSACPGALAKRLISAHACRGYRVKVLLQSQDLTNKENTK